jgi:hypothetical protein
MVKLIFQNPIEALMVPGTHQSFPVECEKSGNAYIVTCRTDEQAYLPLLWGTAKLLEPEEFKVVGNLAGVWHESVFRRHGEREDVTKLIESYAFQKKRGRPRKDNEMKAWIPRDEELTNGAE